MKIQGDYIELDRFLKKLTWVDSGGVAKFIIQDGGVTVNGEVETRRGRKLRKGDQVSFNGASAIVE